MPAPNFYPNFTEEDEQFVDLTLSHATLISFCFKIYEMETLTLISRGCYQKMK